MDLKSIVKRLTPEEKQELKKVLSDSCKPKKKPITISSKDRKSILSLRKDVVTLRNKVIKVKCFSDVEFRFHINSSGGFAHVYNSKLVNYPDPDVASYVNKMQEAIRLYRHGVNVFRKKYKLSSNADVMTVLGINQGIRASIDDRILY